MTFEPRPSTFARTLASNFVRAVPRTDSLTTTPTRRWPNGETHTTGWLPNPARRAAASMTAGVDDVRRDLDARHEVALLDDLAVEDREHLERIEPIDAIQLGDEHRDDAVGRGDEVEPALVRTADVQIRAGDGLREPDRRVILVQLARLDDEHGHRRPGIGRSEGQQVVGATAGGP